MYKKESDEVFEENMTQEQKELRDEEAKERLVRAESFWREVMRGVAAAAVKHHVQLSYNAFECIAEGIEEDLLPMIRNGEDWIDAAQYFDDVFPQKMRNRMMEDAAKSTGNYTDCSFVSMGKALYQALRPIHTNPATPSVAAKMED